MNFREGAIVADEWCDGNPDDSTSPRYRFLSTGDTFYLEAMCGDGRYQEFSSWYRGDHPMAQEAEVLRAALKALARRHLWAVEGGLK